MGSSFSWMKRSANLAEELKMSAATNGNLNRRSGLRQYLLESLSLIVWVFRCTCGILNKQLQVLLFAQEVNKSLILLLAFSDCLLIRKQLLKAGSRPRLILLIQNVVDFLLTEPES
jgi:hypothetical protein